MSCSCYLFQKWGQGSLFPIPARRVSYFLPITEFRLHMKWRAEQSIGAYTRCSPKWLVVLHLRLAFGTKFKSIENGRRRNPPTCIIIRTTGDYTERQSGTRCFFKVGRNKLERKRTNNRSADDRLSPPRKKNKWWASWAPRSTSQIQLESPGITILKLSEQTSVILSDSKGFVQCEPLAHGFNVKENQYPLPRWSLV